MQKESYHRDLGKRCMNTGRLKLYDILVKNLLLKEWDMDNGVAK